MLSFEEIAIVVIDDWSRPESNNSKKRNIVYLKVNRMKKMPRTCQGLLRKI